MTYTRIIPRDLFNDANLLKCLGKLWIELENRFPGVFVTEYVEGGFDIRQYESTGETYCDNVFLMVRGDVIKPTRPMNSRDPWPLYVTDPETFDEISVFEDDGKLTDEFKAWLS